MRVIARRDDETYLVAVDDDAKAAMSNPNALGRILDVGRGKLFPPFNIHSLLARGYWEAHEVSTEETTAMLSRVADLTPTPIVR